MSTITVPESRELCAPYRRARLAFVLAGATAIFLFHATDARAQCAQPPCPLPSEVGNANIAASNAVFDLGSDFFQRLGNQIGPSGRALAGFNPGGGGADMAAATGAPAGTTTAPRYRAWFEGYGSRSHADPQGTTFLGDHRDTVGGIGGVGATLAPGVSIGAAVDQGHSKVKINTGMQSSRIDMTQIGANAAFESGPWTFGIAGIYGTGDIRSSRFDAGGEATASYGTTMWGVLAELSYYWSQAPWRVVPKAGLDWAHVSVASYREAGGATPVAGTASDGERTRIYGALELGYTTRAGGTLYDFSVYGKAIDILSQDVPVVTLSPLNPAAFSPRVIPGVTDARFEFATGAGLSAHLSSLARVYTIYDARFRSGFESHAGTIGMEFRW